QALQEPGAHRLGRRRGELASESYDAGERGGRVGGERLAVRVERRRSDRGGAGVRVLYDHARGLGEGFHALPRRIGVGNIVERELLALQLCERCDGAGDLRFVTIERRELMRVLAVTQVL